MAVYSSTITTGGVSQQLFPANAHRRQGYFQNQSSGDLFIEQGTTASAASLKVPAGVSVVLEKSDDPASAWSVFGATTGQAYYARDN
jgi:hypothetical protein